MIAATNVAEEMCKPSVNRCMDTSARKRVDVINRGIFSADVLSADVTAAPVAGVDRLSVYGSNEGARDASASGMPSLIREFPTLVGVLLSPLQLRHPKFFRVRQSPLPRALLNFLSVCQIAIAVIFAPFFDMRFSPFSLLFSVGRRVTVLTQTPPDASFFRTQVRTQGQNKTALPAPRARTSMTPVRAAIPIIAVGAA